ncbi:hypothetical protein [Mucilaginibacter sp. OK098]|uniref:hypothetical protein n=1 Tax=Mucilaginibacter sp. OK098 TaxID=1855297 RepID=UPI0009203FCB|nr:hypothetical protein [Mucilaginibacter sp. OK098]SHL98288.1 hypothetical protein SAMN05216524_101410 [Mucilaginibacter sp. OK098]
MGHKPRTLAAAGAVPHVDQPINAPIADGASAANEFVTPPDLEEELTPAATSTPAAATSSPPVVSIHNSGTFTFPTTQSLIERENPLLLLDNLQGNGKAIGMFDTYATAQLVDGTYNINVQYIKIEGDRNLLGLGQVMRTYENEAIAAGATQISIHGSTFSNTTFFKYLLQKAGNFGYTATASTNGIILNKILTNIK